MKKVGIVLMLITLLAVGFVGSSSHQAFIHDNDPVGGSPVLS